MKYLLAMTAVVMVYDIGSQFMPQFAESARLTVILLLGSILFMAERSYRAR